VAGIALLGRSRGEARPVPDTRAGLAWPVPGTEQQVTAEVLNGTSRNGLARLGARVLRKHGIDVIATGNAESTAVTRVIARRSGVRPAEAVRRALGAGAVESKLDSTRRVDVTVILGEDFKPVLPLHP